MDTPNEVEQLHLKASVVIDESLECTQRMIRLCEESEEIGMKTLVTLSEQGEQLDRIEEDMDVIHSDIKEAERNLTGMGKCCGGFCTCPCFGGKDKDDQKAWQTTEDGKVISSQPRVADNRNGSGPVQTGFITRIVNDAREDEMEENMGQVSSMIGNLKNMAIDMGSELEAQNKQIDRINLKAQSNETRITAANVKATQLLKS